MKKNVKSAGPPGKWYKKDGLIHFKLISDGTTGPQWVKRLEEKGVEVRKSTKKILNSPKFKPTFGREYNIAVLPATHLKSKYFIIEDIYALADSLKLTELNPEAACLIRYNFSDQEIEAMGFWWIVIMYNPTVGFRNNLKLLIVDCIGNGLFCCKGSSGKQWDMEDGFAFELLND